jgi:hypothetical protein
MSPGSQHRDSVDDYYRVAAKPPDIRITCPQAGVCPVVKPRTSFTAVHVGL